jgi:hypothetical protein
MKYLDPKGVKFGQVAKIKRLYCQTLSEEQLSEEQLNIQFCHFCNNLFIRIRYLIFP